MRLFIRRFGSAAIVVFTAVIALSSCQDDPAGPQAPIFGHFALAPSFESSAAGIVDLDRVRVLVTRTADSSIATDTVVQIAPDADSLALDLSVQLESHDETFSLTMQFITPAGDTAFVGGPMTVVATTSSDVTPVAIPLPIEYVGVGFDAADIRITTAEPIVAFGDTLLLQAEALDSSGSVIPNTPIEWSSRDQRLSVPDPAVGRVVGQPLRGTGSVVATLLTGQADTIPVFVEPVPSGVAIVSGDAQTATAGATLAQPLAVSVTADDGPGVEGVLVVFAAGTGSVDPESALTDAEGLAQTTWTLGRAAGTQTATAAVEAIPDTVTFTAMANAGAPAAVAIGPATGAITTIGGTQQFGATVTDGNGNEVTGAVVAWELTDSTVASIDATGQATGTANGTTTVLATAGTATGTATLTVSQVATQLAFTVQPIGVAATSAIAPAVEVSLLDAGGTVATNATDNVTVAIGNNPSGGTLSGTLTVAAVGGVATYGDLSIDAEGVGYTLVATATGVTSATSTAFDVSIAPSSVIRWTNATGGSWNELSNWSGGAIPTATDSVAIDLAGSYTVDMDGIASVENLILGGTGSTPTLRISGAGNAALTVADGFNNAGTILLTNDGFNAAATLTVTGGTLTNTGAITAQVGSGGSGGRTITADIDNQGTISAESFTLGIQNTGRTFTTTNGTLATPNGNLLQIAGGTVVFGSGTQLTGNGIYRLPVNTTLDLASDFTLTAGDYQLELASETDGISVNGPGMLTVADTLVLGQDTVNAPLAILEVVRVQSENTVVNGALSVLSGGLLRIGGVGNSALTVASGFTNAGTMLLTNDGFNAAATLTVTGGTLTNTGAITAQVGSGGSGGRTIAADIDNQGTISAESFTLGIQNTGRTFTTTNGTLATPNGNLLQIAGGTVVFGSGTQLTGSGIYRLPVNTTLDLASDFTLTAGDYQLELASETDGISVNGPGMLTVADTLVLGRDTINAPLTIQDVVLVQRENTVVNGALSVLSGGLLRIGGVGNSALTVANGFTNAGTMLLTNDGLNAAATLTVTSGTITNVGSIDAQVGSGGVGGRIITGDIDHRGTIGLTFGLTLNGQLIVPNTVSASISGGGNTMAVSGFDVDGLTVDNVPLVSTNGTITRFDNVTFQNYGEGVTQLRVDHPGIAIPFTFDNVTFDVAPASGTYLSVNDNAVDVNTLTIDLPNSTPTDGTSRESTTGGAIINWDAELQPAQGNSWTGGAGDGLWSSAGNWSLGRIPNTTDTVLITLDGTYTVTVDAPTTVYALEVGGTTGAQTVAVSGQTLTVDSAATFGSNGILNLSSGIIGGTGDISVDGSMNWTGGALNITGATNVGSGATLTMTGGASKTFSGNTINNSGDIVWDGGAFYSYSGGTLNNLIDGTMDMQGALTFSRQNGLGVFNNAGTLTKMGTGTSNIAIPFDNATTGTLAIQTDTLRMSLASTYAGTLSIPSSTTLYLYNSAHTIDTILTGAGSVLFGGGAGLTLNGTYSFSNLVLPNGTFVFNGPVTATDSLVVQGANVTFNSTLTAPPFLRFTSGAIAGSADISVVDSLVWLGGALNTTGTTTIASGQLLTMTGGASKTFSGNTINNSGDIVWDGGAFYSYSGGTLNNLIDGTMDMQGALTFSRQNGLGVFNNAGTLTKMGTGTSNIAIPFDNATTGTLAIQTDTLRMSLASTYAGTLSIPSSTTLYLYNSAHTIDTILTGAGSVLFGGGAGLTLNGTYSFSNLVLPNGTFVFNGPVTATDSLVVQGANVTFNSTLTAPPFLRFTSGAIAGSADISVVDSLVWLGGALNTTGTTTIASGQLLTMTGGASKTFSGNTINNSGDIVWDGGAFYSYSGGTLNNLIDGTMDMQGALTFSRQNGLGVFNNAGTLTKMGTGTSNIAIPFDNATTGTLAIQTDTLRMSLASTYAGTLSIPSSTTLYLYNSAHTIDTILTGAGSVLFGGGAGLTLNGTYSFSNLVLPNGTFVFNGPVTATDSLVVQGANVTFNSTLTAPPFLRFTSGAIAGSADISVVDSLVWLGGALNTTGTTTIASGQLLTMTGGASKTFSGNTINNSGDIVWDGGAFYSYSGGTLNNLIDGTMDMQGALTFSRQNGLGVFNNAGTLTKMGTGTSNIAIPFDNATTGTLAIQTDTLRMSLASTYAGTLSIPSSTTLYLYNSAHTIDTILTGAGSVLFGGGAGLTLNGTYSFSNLVLPNGTFVFNGPVTATDSLVVQGANVTFNSTLTAPPFLRFTSGAIAGSADISVVDSLVWLGGALNTTGTTTIASGQLLTMTGGASKTFSGNTINNSGDIVWDGGAFYSYSGGTLNNLIDGTMDMQGALTFSRQNGLGVFNNAGTLTKTGTGIGAVTIPLTNTGIVDAQAGTLDLNSTFTHADAALIRGTSTLDIASATYSALSGEFDADVAGTAGTLPITGDLVLDTDSDLNIDIGGTADGEYDVIAVTGDVTIDGNININLLGAYSPNQDDEYTIMTWTGTLTANNIINVPTEWTAIVDVPTSSLILRYTGI